ncbi:hypothetical protein LPJ73_006020 [Coemansia sp. RSA 2703]|nr:hypothetical protein LPJ73_006020 [Coemansia sp. RSA 2703]KAJ2382041.1 hypothetical protein GGI05_005782 [Coemansia sp. RSA 2603]
MQLYLTTIISSALIFANTVATSSYRDIGADKDSTIVYNTDFCGDTLCAQINHGQEPTLTASSSSTSASRIILGFTLPQGIKSSQIKQCQLQMQRPVQDADGAYVLSASEVKGLWDADTVSGVTPLVPGKIVGSVDAVGGERPAPIDVSQACKDAKDGAFSLLVDSSGPTVIFPSMKTGAAAMLRIYTS